MTQKTVLITGSSGFVGSSIVKKLVDDDFEVHGCDIQNISKSDNKLIFHLACSNIEGYISLLNNIKPDFIIHCAGNANVNFSVINPLVDYDRNVTVLYQLLEAISLIDIRPRIIFPSSAAVYGTVQKLPIKETDALAPISPYGLHKKFCEDLCLYYIKNKGLNISIARIFSAYGPGLKKQIFWDMFKKISSQKKLDLFGTGSESRDFIFIDDLVNAIILLLFKGECGEIYNIGSGVESSIKELASLFVQEINLNIPITFNNIVNTGNPLNWRGDITKIENLGFKTKFNLKDGIKKLEEWLENE